MGDFGRMAPVAEQRRIIAADVSDRGAQAIASAVAGVAGQQIDQQQQEAKALARVKASNLLLDRESQINTITNDLGEKLRRGELKPDDASAAYEQAVGALDPMQPDGLDDVESEQFGLSLRRMQQGGLSSLDGKVSQARITSAQSDLLSRMDLLGKDAGMPGADPLAIVRRMDQEDIDTVGRMAYGMDWDRRKQDFKDGIFTTHASQQLVGASNDLGKLQELQHQLSAEDGFYTSRLDADKRTQLLSSVTGRIHQVQEHNARQAEIAEMRAMRVMAQMDKQAATGIPPTPADQQRWQAAVAGTSMAGEFNTRVEQMNEVQSLLRQPLAEQQAYIQQKRQEMAQNGGSVDQIANLDRLDRAVAANMKLMRDQPLEWNAMRTGQQELPLDFTDIATPEGQMTLVGQLGGRFDTLNAMRNQIGPEVNRNPFLPQEAQMLKAALAQVDDNTKLKVLGALAEAAPSGSDFKGALTAIAADDPQLMLAGLAQANQLKGDDGTDVPSVLLAGSKVLADKSTPMPSEQKLRTAFDESIGQAIPSGTQEREHAYTAFKSLYAGLAGPEGVQHDGSDAMVDDDLAQKALKLSTGGVVERAGAKVIKPYGWDDDRFDDAVDSQLTGLAEGSGIPVGQLEELPLLPVPGVQGSYYLLNGGRPQLDPKSNQPMVVKLQ